MESSLLFSFLFKSDKFTQGNAAVNICGIQLKVEIFQAKLSQYLKKSVRVNYIAQRTEYYNQKITRIMK